MPAKDRRKNRHPAIAAEVARIQKDGGCGKWKRRAKISDEDFDALTAAKKTTALAGLCLQPVALCELHGKPSPKGKEHWNYKGAGFSKYEVDVDGRLAHYHRFLDDTDISQRSDIAISRALIQDLLVQVEGHDAPAWRKRLRSLVKGCDRAHQGGDSETFSKAWSCLVEAIEEGADLDEIGRSIQDQQRVLRQQIDSEVKRLKVDGHAPEEIMAWTYQLLRLFRAGLRDVAKVLTKDSRKRVRALAQAEATLLTQFRTLVGESDETVM